MKKRLTVLVLLTLVTTAICADDWAQWRGPNFNGSSDERNLPTSWSRTENIAWRVDLPGPSAATPVVWGNQVFVSSTDLSNDTLLAMCFDRQSGKQLWSHQIAKGIGKDIRSSYSAPSPVTNGKLAIFFYGNGDMVCYDMDGKQQWKQNMGPFAFMWTFSTSPVLVDGKLILQVLQRNVAVNGRGAPRGNKSYLVALDPATGKEIWRHVRPSKALAESLEAFTTPVPFEYDGKVALLVVGGDCLTAHDLKGGDELWRWGTWNPRRVGSWRLVPSPVAGAGVVLACGPKKEPIFAIDATGKGILDDDSILWDSSKERTLSSDVPTPAFADGDFFILSDLNRSLSRVEPKTGKIKWSITTPGRKKYEASPTVADAKVYLVNFDGDVVVVSADSGKVLKVIPMEDNSESKHDVRSSVVVAGGQLLIRTNRTLFCVGK
jgi:outer membrane protein assembly factor BamB